MGIIWNNEREARGEILEAVKRYYLQFKREINDFKPGDRISYSGRVFDEKEMCSLTEATLDFWLTTGHFSEKLEADFSKFLGIKYVHLVNSGSSANLIAISCLTSRELGDRRIKKNDEVITVAAAFPTTVTPIIQCGAIPVFLDITIPQYNIDVSKLEEALSNKTKAVIIAHTMGNPFNVEVVKKFCDKHNLWLIEDNCDSLGSSYTINGEKRYTGTIGDIGTSSFYPPHHITMGEGGAVYTNDPVLSRLILSYRDWGRDCICPSGCDNLCGHRFDGQYGKLPKGYDHKFVYSHFGYNLKITDLQASIGCEQLKKLPEFIEARRRNWKKMYNLLVESNINQYIILPEKENNSDPSWFGFLITVKNGISRNKIIHDLERHNIQTRMLFAGNLTKHPCFTELDAKYEAYRVVGDLYNTDRIMKDTFWVGVYPGLNDKMIEYTANIIIESVNEQIMTL